MTTPNKERIKLFIEALESGRYIQGQGTLARFIWDPETQKRTSLVEYCCLGVACEVAIARNGPVQREDGNDRIVYRDTETDRGDSWALPESVVEWYGFPGTTGAWLAKPDGGTTDMIGMNDVDGLSFATIATALREHYDIGHGED